MALDMDYIVAFLCRVEGQRQTRGYVPSHIIAGGSANYRGDKDPKLYKAMGASGVTIATGCDLGQTDAATLAGYGLSKDIVSLFTFYFGKKKDAALAALHARPLTITEAQAKACDLAVHGGYLKRYVRPWWERHCKARAFDDLPKEAQAVVMSVCFQKGCGGVKKDWPKLFGHLVALNWQAASQELKSGFSQYQSRRKAEGEELARIC